MRLSWLNIWAVTLVTATTLCVSCGRGGTLLPPEPVAPRVIKPLFSTGAGPNDMVFGNDSLYVANSLDNTVVRYALDGSVLATQAFPEFASPSYLALGDDRLVVVANGDNTISSLDVLDFTKVAEPIHFAGAFDLHLGLLAFAGPGVPTVWGEMLAVPLAGIEEFGSPTVYQRCEIFTFASGLQKHARLLPGSGQNGQMAQHVEATDTLVISSAGELQFDAEFNPSITTDSYIEVFDATNITLQSAINLGPVGAGRFAVDATGSTAFISNLLNGNLYQVNLNTGEIVHGKDNPIVLTTEFTFISDVTYTPDGMYVLATSFNTDELYVIDAATGEVNPAPYNAPYDLSLAADLLAGCANVEVAPDPERPGKYAAYVLYGVANAVAKVELY